MSTPVNDNKSTGFFEVLLAFFKLGLTSFGGPVAHLGYFREEFVNRRGWLDEKSYGDLVAMCQFLPGPASSQVGMGLGVIRAGIGGAVAAWIGFTLPSALAMILFALGITQMDLAADGNWLHGLKVAAVAVVAQAVWGMAKSLCPDRNRATLAILAAMLVLAWPTAGGQVAAIVFGGLVGWRFLHAEQQQGDSTIKIDISAKTGLMFLALFFILLFLLPLLAINLASPGLSILDSFFRSGALVFGGGHVVLPLLQAEVVSTGGWLEKELFMAGYGAAQAVPGPLFTFAAYLGAAMDYGPAGWSGGLLALVAVFLPSFLLVLGALPFWQAIRNRQESQAILMGVNAAVVGLLLAALYHPVFSSGILNSKDFIICLAAFTLLVFWKTPPWLVVILAAVASTFIELTDCF